MTSPSDAANAYLASRFNVGLEQLLLDIVGGHTSPAMAALTDVNFDRFDIRHHSGGDISEGYAGQITLQGVAYSWRAWIYRDVDGGRFLSDLSDFSPVSWRAEIRMAG